MSEDALAVALKETAIERIDTLVAQRDALVAALHAYRAEHDFLRRQEEVGRTAECSCARCIHARAALALVAKEKEMKNSVREGKDLEGSRSEIESQSTDFEAAFKTACRIHMEWTIGRYLMSHAEGRCDGFEKAQQHIAMCQFYVAAFRGWNDPDTVRRLYSDDFDALHDASQDLTDRLDETIGFPLKGMPDYAKLEPLFFERFHSIAMATLVSKPDGNSA